VILAWIALTALPSLYVLAEFKATGGEFRRWATLKIRLDLRNALGCVNRVLGLHPSHVCHPGSAPKSFLWSKIPDAAKVDVTLR
jgi:hypothetical protein